METTDLLDKLLDLAEQQAFVVRFSLKEEIMPTWLLIDAQGDTEIIPTPWKTDLEKMLARVFIQARMHKLQTVAYSFLTEAWSAQQPADWKAEDGISETERPMRRADRRESVIACACDGTTTKWRVWRIIRDHLEQVVKLERQQGLENDDFSSWMSELLPLPAAPAEEGQADE